MKKQIVKHATINAVLTGLYVVLVASFIFYVPRHFALQDKPDTVFAPIIMLMLFVFSASVTGLLVLGRPIFWYLEGKKSEAITLFLYTLTIFFFLMLIAFFILVKTA